MSETMILLLLNQIESPALIVKDGTVVHINRAAEALFPNGEKPGTFAQLLGTQGEVPDGSAGTLFIANLCGKHGAYTATICPAGDRELVTLCGAQAQDKLISDRLPTSAFLLNLANRLRKPASNAHTLVQNLCGKIPAKYYEADKAYFDELNKSLHLQLKITDQLFRLATRDQLPALLNPKFGNLAQAFRRITETCIFYAGLCGTKLACSVETKEDLFTVFSEYYFEHIILSLLSNSLKYNRDNNPICMTLSQQNNNAIFTVTDQGTGISSDLLPTVFSHLAYDALSEKLTSGIGIGLYFVKAITDALGGNIAISSQEGVGTTISISLPITDKLPQPADDQTLLQPAIPLPNPKDYLIFFADCLPAEEFDLNK